MTEAKKLIDTGVVDPHLDLDFGEEGERILAVAVAIEIVLLPAIALHLADRAGLERGEFQGLEDALSEERLDDGDDFLHRAPFRPSIRAAKDIN